MHQYLFSLKNVLIAIAYFLSIGRVIRYNSSFDEHKGPAREKTRQHLSATFPWRGYGNHIHQRVLAMERNGSQERRQSHQTFWGESRERNEMVYIWIIPLWSQPPSLGLLAGTTTIPIRFLSNCANITA